MNATPTTTSISTDVAIVGAGPSGLMLAIELGCRGVPCVVLEEALVPPSFPKANATSARTMEHYRRRGFADRVRASGLPAERAQDIVYCTRGGGHELARFRIPSPAQARAGAVAGDYGDGAWPTPELPHRGQQMFIEPILQQQALSYPSVTLWRGTRVTAVREKGGVVQLEALRDGRPAMLKARFAVGCDGARSVVRESMGIGYSGRGREERDFFGGQMLSIYFRSAGLAAQLSMAPAWTYWIVNPEQRGVLIAIDGRDTWVAGIQLAPGQGPQDVDVPATLQRLMGQPVAHELIATGAWLAGYMLVADRLGVGRRFVVGDAAHLFTPAAGMGYNTSIDDAVNLGWKLAAVCKGWAPEALLDSYEAERKPIAERNTRFAKQMADSMGSLASPPDLESSAAAREALGSACSAHIRREFNIPGLQLGVRYASAIVASEAVAPPPDEPNRYMPSGYPGARAPHIALADGRSLHDRLGPEFSLLCLRDGLDASAWVTTARSLGVALEVVVQVDAAARDLYGADCVLIRPDLHIAWRGPADAPARDILGRSLGHPMTSP